MNKEFLKPDQIGNVIIENLKKVNTIFVFSTDICMNSWAEWCIKNSDITGINAIAMNQFMAWDTFKKEYVVAREDNKQAIPSILRKVFINDLLSQNAMLVKEGKEPIFSSVISKKYAEEAYSFADWLSSSLSSLKIWYDRFVPWAEKNPELVDAEDKDYLTLYKKYVEFLGDNMFEPSWTNADFNNNENEFFIFFPEQFSDFDEYKALLSESKNVHIFNIPKDSSVPLTVYKYSDARKELRRTALYLRELNKKGVDYRDIAVHVPELKTYEPYIEREFTNYCIPFVLRAGQSLTINNAGSIFENFSSCYKNQYDYDSVRSALSNCYVPWKLKDVNRNLIKIGQELHVICNYDESKAQDNWLKALKNTSSTNEREFNLYKAFRDYVDSMCTAKSFKEILQLWFAFKSQFLQEDGFDEKADLILSRCIKCLNDLILIEEDFIGPKALKINNHYDFFLNELRQTQYTPQEKNTGINIFDYKVAACSAYDYNIVLNCSQTAVSVVYKKLGFLNSQKRQNLGLSESDGTSKVFLELYQKFNEKNPDSTIFSYCENSFSGYSIPHNCFVSEKSSEDFAFLDADDFILNEEKAFLDLSKSDNKENKEFALKALSNAQIKQFNVWKSHCTENTSNDQIDYSYLQEKINEVLTSRKINGVSQEILKITQSDMADFFPCPRKWILGRVINLKDESLEAVLFNNFDQGNINHKILELLFDEFKQKDLELPLIFDDGTFGEKETLINEMILINVDKAIHSFDMEFKNSPIVMEVLESQKDGFAKVIRDFLSRICESQEKKGYAGYKIYSTEQWLGTKPQNKDYAFCGKIDSILVGPNGEIAIIDYKNTAVPPRKDCIYDENTSSLKNFQCPLYVTIWNLSKEGCPVSSMDFQSITKDDRTLVISEKERKPREGYYYPEEYQPTLDVFNEYSDLFYEKVTNLKLSPVSSSQIPQEVVDKYTDCQNCSFKTICRTTYSVASRKI